MSGLAFTYAECWWRVVNWGYVWWNHLRVRTGAYRTGVWGVRTYIYIKWGVQPHQMPCLAVGGVRVAGHGSACVPIRSGTYMQSSAGGVTMSACGAHCDIVHERARCTRRTWPHGHGCCCQHAKPVRGRVQYVGPRRASARRVHGRLDSSCSFPRPHHATLRCSARTDDSLTFETREVVPKTNRNTGGPKKNRRARVV